MLNPALKQIRKISIGIIFLLASGMIPFSAAAIAKTAKEELSPLEQQARDYRRQGMELQRNGDIEGAMAFYQKAVQLDPAYAVAHNDLGVIYEMKGMSERAEQSYLLANRLDSKLLSAYSNLGLFYQARQDWKKSAFYWRKRLELGSLDDPWTEKAQNHLNDVLSASGQKFQPRRQQTVVPLDKNYALAMERLNRARQYFQDQDYKAALKEALSAQKLDPGNAEIEQAINEIENKLAHSPKKEAAVAPVKTTAKAAAPLDYDKEMARLYLKKAQASYNRQEYAEALRDAIEAFQIQPNNAEVEKFITKIQIQLLSK